MSPHPVSVGRADTAAFRQELLSRLGLRADASDQDIEAAHTELVEFLEAAPNQSKSWAAAQVREADETFALLTGPEEDLVSPAAAALATTSDGPDETLRNPLAAPAASAPAKNKKRRTLVLWAAVPLLLIAVVIGVYSIGKGSEVPGISGQTTNAAPTQTASGPPPPPPIDKAKVATLTKKVGANPKDIASLQGLGDTYFASADYKSAAGWERKILAVDPKNQVALLALGAAEFNQGNSAEAKKHWLIAAGLYPNNAEVHYDLGFLYLSQTPPDKAKMTEEWNKVIAIDPNSSIAKTVAQHLKPAPAQSAHPAK